jgi:hypothetical protein
LSGLAATAILDEPDSWLPASWLRPFLRGRQLLIILILVLRRLKVFDAGMEAVKKLSLIVTYCMVINVFLVLMEVFTTFYSRIPSHVEHFELSSLRARRRLSACALDVGVSACCLSCRPGHAPGAALAGGHALC